MLKIMVGIILILTIVALVLLVYAIVQWVREWHQNNKSPILTVPATVVAKRENVVYQQHNVGDLSKTYCFYTTTNSEYFATFEKESGERMEFLLGGSEYGMIAEGDIGKLTFQGTRFLSFER